MTTDTRISDVELRMSEHTWEMIPEHERAHIKELTQAFAYAAGYDRFFEFIWLKLTLEDYFMMELVAPGFMDYFKRVE